ncbi:MAG TPA: hypothetical protein VNO34_09845 [Actinomycetota bacterium]|nr:hypothetical protein [Actinomycetota bacterium]
MTAARELLKRVLPEGTIAWYRRRRALRNWLREVAHELYDRQAKLQVEELEGRLLARRPDITARLTKDLLSRMDLVLQELDRKLEGLRARHGSELRALGEQVDALREELRALREEVAALGERTGLLPTSVALRGGGPTARGAPPGPDPARSAPEAAPGPSD